jgi:hypothetical protein
MGCEGEEEKERKRTMKAKANGVKGDFKDQLRRY